MVGAEARGAGRRGIRRLFTLKKLIGAFFTVCLLAVGAFVVLYVLVPVPDANAQAELQSNVYKYSDGKIIARTGKVNREIVGLDQIPLPVQRTFVAAENKTFYKDSGVDVRGTTRALFNTLSGKGRQGGSTITQQYVKNYYLNQDQTVTRKLKELVIALKVDRRKSKSEILAGYVNTSYYGRGAYGIQAAAQAYYGVDAARLTVRQGAYLAAVLQAPSQYDWAVAGPEGKRLVTARWNYVLDNMVSQGWLDASARRGMTFPVPQEPKAAPGLEGQTGYLVEAADKQLEQQGVSQEEIDAGGWTITLNIDEKRQKDLVSAVDRQLESKLHRGSDKTDATVQAGATSVDPRTGKVVALYGGTGATVHWISNATREDYQPASTFKAVVLSSALENHARTQGGDPIGVDTRYSGESGRPVVGSDTPFAPQNEDGADYGEITVQQAMNDSVNSVFAQMVVDVGPAAVKKTALAMGMRDEGFPERPAIALGTMDASTWDMAGVYATLDHHGRKVAPSIVASAVHKGVETKLPDPVGEQVISRKTADTVTRVLEGVVKNGTGAAADTPDYQAAGKTGTSENNKSAWFVGYTPQLATAVALFGESPKAGGGQVTLTGTANSGRANGGGFPAAIWADYTLAALDGGSDAQFDLRAPDRVAVDDGGQDPPRATDTPSTTPSTSPSDEGDASDEPSPPADEPSAPPVESTPSGTPGDPSPPAGGETGPPGGEETTPPPDGGGDGSPGPGEGGNGHGLGPGPGTEG